MELAWLMRFTPQIAREMAAKSHAARRQKSIAAAMPQQIPANSPHLANEPDAFRLDRLMRVRKQLSRIDALAAKEEDPKRIKEFADACSRLQEQERQLAGRPLPGTDRPKRARGHALAPQEPTEAIGGTPPVAPRVSPPSNEAQQ